MFDDIIEGDFTTGQPIESDSTLWRAADDLVMEDLTRGLPSNYANYIRSGPTMRNAYLKSISDWLGIRTLGDYVFLPASAEAKILKRVFQPVSSVSEHEAFFDVMNWRVPRMRELPWDRVIEIRNHPLLEGFRCKLQELALNLNNQNEKELKELLNEMELFDLREFARLVGSSPMTDVFKGFATNTPLPLPVNPYGVWSSVKDVKKSIELRRRFGWIFFLLSVDESNHF